MQDTTLNLHAPYYKEREQQGVKDNRVLWTVECELPALPPSATGHEATHFARTRSTLKVYRARAWSPPLRACGDAMLDTMRTRDDDGCYCTRWEA